MAAWKQFGVALVAVLAVLLPGTGQPCRMVPDTTWGLTDRAERIVLGRVVRTWRVESIPEDFAPPSETEEDRLLREVIRSVASRDRVEVEVLEVWKGGPARTLTVVSDKHWDTLRDVLEREGRDHTLLLFLSPTGDDWRTTEVWSEKLLAPAHVAAWRDLVKEALALQAHPPVKEGALRDWNVLAALNPGTRKEGLEALFANVPLWDRDWSASFPVPKAHPLDSIAQRRIAGDFVAHPDLPTLPLLLLALHGHADTAVDRLSIQLIDEALARSDSDAVTLLEVQDAIDVLGHRLGMGGAETERCHMAIPGDEEDMPANTRCVRARWEHLRSLHAEQAR